MLLVAAGSGLLSAAMHHMEGVRSEQRAHPFELRERVRRVEPTGLVRWVIPRPCEHEQSLHVSSQTVGWNTV